MKGRKSTGNRAEVSAKPKVEVQQLQVRFAPVGPLAGGLPDVPHGPQPPYGPGVTGSSPAAAETGMRMMVASRSSWDEAAAPSALEAQIAQIRQYARAADTDDAEMRELGLAGLRRLAARLLDADPAVRALRAKKPPHSGKGAQQIARFAAKKKFSLAGPHERGETKAFVIGAAEHFKVSERTIENWIADARNLPK